ncbi:MAG: hypothetical protein V1765_00195 [bacterium]
MKRFIIFAIAIMLAITTLTAKDWHASRIRLLAHGSDSLTQSSQLRFHFIPAGNLMGEVKPLGYLGWGWQVASWLNIEPVVGWCFATDEPIISVRVTPTWEKFWSWTDIELNTTTHNGYWFSQINYQTSKLCHIGVEGEGWGNFYQAGSWSNGFGPNVLLRLKQMGIDLAVHYRTIDKVNKPEFFIRIHFFL